MKVSEALNLYRLHSDPNQLRGHDKFQHLLTKRTKWACIRITYQTGYKIIVGSTLQELVKTINSETIEFIGMFQQYNEKKFEEMITTYVHPDHKKERTPTIEKFKQTLANQEINPKVLFYAFRDEEYWVVVVDGDLNEVAAVIPRVDN